MIIIIFKTEKFTLNSSLKISRFAKNVLKLILSHNNDEKL